MAIPEDLEKRFKLMWDKTENRRKTCVEWAKDTEDEVAKAIYILCSEICCLQQLMILQINATLSSTR